MLSVKQKKTKPTKPIPTCMPIFMTETAEEGDWVFHGHKGIAARTFLWYLKDDINSALKKSHTSLLPLSWVWNR